MEKYSTDSRCPKCGNEHVKTEYEAVFGQNFLRRICQRCGYTWNQQPLDAD